MGGLAPLGPDQKGIEASEEMTLKEIAANNSTGPHDIYARIKDIVPN